MRVLLLSTFLIIIFVSCSREWSNTLSPDEDHKSDIPTLGLVAYYPFNGNANDESGNGNHGLIYGKSVEFLNGLFDQCIKFDNSKSGTFTINDYIDLPKISINELSVSLWTKYGRGSSTYYSGSIYSIGEFPARQFRVVITNDGKVSGQITVNNAIYNTVEIDISNKEWYFVTVTVTTDHLKIYKNGVLVDSKSLGFNLNFVNAFQHIALHRFNGSASSRFTGEIDNLCVYSRSLTHSEIYRLFNE